MAEMLRAHPDVTSAEGGRPPEARNGDPLLVAMAGRMAARKRLEKPLLFGSILCALATAFVYRHHFFPEVEELRAREYQYYEKKRQEIVERRQKQLAELAERKASR